MTVAELFCGAGGASVGLHAAGLEHVAAVDFNADAIACLSFCMGDGLFARPHPALGAYPGVARLQEVQRWSPVAADVWWGSPPCQSFSAAGNRLGPGDSRNGFPHVFAALDEALVLLDGSFPTWLVFENVRGMLSHKGTGCDDTCPGCYFAIVLEEVDTRFPCVSWFVLDAADFGVPQRRRRVFIVGGPVPVVAPTPTHSREALEAAKADAILDAAARAVVPVTPRQTSAAASDHRPGCGPGVPPAGD